MPRVMGMDLSMLLQMWVDASYATHRDMRGHIGGITSMGCRVAIHNCSKQKLNIKRSTESEVVMASD